MGKVIHSQIYSCYNDCKLSGCPKHEAKLMYNTVTDSFTFDNGNGDSKTFNLNELKVFIELIKSFIV